MMPSTLIALNIQRGTPARGCHNPQGTGGLTMLQRWAVPPSEGLMGKPLSWAFMPHTHFFKAWACTTCPQAPCAPLALALAASCTPPLGALPPAHPMHVGGWGMQGLDVTTSSTPKAVEHVTLGTCMAPWSPSSCVQAPRWGHGYNPDGPPTLIKLSMGGCCTC